MKIKLKYFNKFITMVIILICLLCILILLLAGQQKWLLFPLSCSILLTILMSVISFRESKTLGKFNTKLRSGIDGGLAHIIELNFSEAHFGELRKLGENLNAMLKELKNVFWAIKENLLETKFNNSTLENMKLIMISYIQKVTNIGNVRAELERICKKINETTSSTKEILTLIVSLAEKTDKEALAIKQSSKALEHLLGSISDIITITSDKQRLAVALKEITQSGGERIRTTSQVIRQLNENAGEMLNVIAIIDEIAETTNILSINASIEAAHTGQEGKGFRVIADEIKKLVASTKKNASEIALLLKEQVNNIGLALAESTQSGEVFEQVSDEVEDAANTWLKISENTQEMSSRTILIQEATSRMLTITGEVQESSDAIRLSVEKINLETSDLDETSSRTLDIIERVTITNEEAKKSTLDILQQLNDMGNFVKKLNKSIDFFNLGKKIFYFCPDYEPDQTLIKTLIHNEYEIYPLNQSAELIKHVREETNAIVLAEYERVGDKSAFQELVFKLKKNQEYKDLKLGIISGKKDAILEKNCKANYCVLLSPDKNNPAALYAKVLIFVKNNRARGLRKNIRVNCSSKDNIKVQIHHTKQTHIGRVINISSSALIAGFEDTFRPGPGEFKHKFDLILGEKSLTLTSTALHEKENNHYLITYNPLPAGKDKERIFRYIFEKLQKKLQHGNKEEE